MGRMKLAGFPAKQGSNPSILLWKQSKFPLTLRQISLLLIEDTISVPH
jgi:hypothetical protein